MPDQPIVTPDVIREPESGSWWIGDPWAAKGLKIVANAADRNITLIRIYQDNTTDPESVELHLTQVDDLLAALANVKAWLERAIAQHPAPDDLPF